MIKTIFLREQLAYNDQIKGFQSVKLI